jgi:hypothetical protein
MHSAARALFRAAATMGQLMTASRALVDGLRGSIDTVRAVDGRAYRRVPSALERTAHELAARLGLTPHGRRIAAEPARRLAPMPRSTDEPRRPIVDAHGDCGPSTCSSAGAANHRSFEFSAELRLLDSAADRLLALSATGSPRELGMSARHYRVRARRMTTTARVLSCAARVRARRSPASRDESTDAQPWRDARVGIDAAAESRIDRRRSAAQG